MVTQRNGAMAARTQQKAVGEAIAERDRARRTRRGQLHRLASLTVVMVGAGLLTGGPGRRSVFREGNAAGTLP